MEMNAAEAMVYCLEQENVEIIFGLPGGAIVPIYDALYHSKIKHVLVRHEQGAAHAADGYARATGRVGVCMATSGPGATNLVTGIANAYMDSVPLVIFTGQVSTSQIGTDAFQEVDITGITIPVTKHNYLVKDPSKIPETIKRAFFIASTGRHGPVLIDLPKDVAGSTVKFHYPKGVTFRGYKKTPRGHPAKVKEAAKMINRSKRPVIYAGGGIISSGAGEELKQLAEAVNAPVTNTFMGLSSFPADHPLFLGMLGLHGTRYANMAITESDLIIALGARFDDRVTGELCSFAPNAQIIHIDIDPAEIGKNMCVHVPIVGDVKQVIKALLPLLVKNDRPQWLQRIQELRILYPLRYERGNGLKPQFIIEQIAMQTKGEAVIVTDVGQHQMWVAQYYGFKHPRSLISSGGLGAMGFGLPAAIGAQMGLPGKPVILITGDGSFQMNMQELATVREQKLPLKVFVFNNRLLGMVRQLQEVYCEGRYMAVDLKFNPDFSVLAKAYGMSGYKVSSEEEISRLLPEILASPEPVLVDCLVSPEENVSPMVLAGYGIHESIEC